MKPNTTKTKAFQTKVISKREEKKRINIKANSLLNFQIGLIVSLLLVLLVSETRIEAYIPGNVSAWGIDIEEPYVIGAIVVEPEPQPKATIAKRPEIRRPLTTVTPVENIVETQPVETGALSGLPDAPVAEPAPSAPTSTPTGPSEPEAVANIMGVQFVPVFPGCENLGSNKEKIACMSAKINKFIGRHFNTDVAEGESGERQRITVQFKIDTKGQVTEVKARAPDRALEKEAARVVGKLPSMEPGRQGDKAVSVMYMVPIVFEIE